MQHIWLNIEMFSRARVKTERESNSYMLALRMDDKYPSPKMERIKIQDLTHNVLMAAQLSNWGLRGDDIKITWPKLD